VNLPSSVSGVGIDAIEVARMRRLLERLPRAYERLFSEHECDYSEGFANPFPRYAARFAAKEAVGKALGIGIIGFVWREIEVRSPGKPLVALYGNVAAIARHLGVTRIELSLSHTDEQAYAVAVAINEGGDGAPADGRRSDRPQGVDGAGEGPDV